MSYCRYKDNSPDNWANNSNWPDNSNGPDNSNEPENSNGNRRGWLRDDEDDDDDDSAVLRRIGRQSDEDDDGDSPRMRIFGRERNDEESAILAALGSRRNGTQQDGDAAVLGVRSQCGSGVSPLSGCEDAQGRDCRPKWVGPCEKREYRKCVNPDCTCAYYPADCRNSFWPEFAKPRWLPCKDLYCNGGLR